MGARVAYYFVSKNGCSKILGSHWGGMKEVKNAEKFGKKVFRKNKEVSGEELMNLWLEELKKDSFYDEDDYDLVDDEGDTDCSDYGCHSIDIFY